MSKNCRSFACIYCKQAWRINTIIFQNVLSRPEWKGVLAPEDYRALNSLFHSHINPYGLFPLDLLRSLGITQDFPVNDGVRIETAEEQEEDLVELLYA